MLEIGQTCDTSPTYTAHYDAQALSIRDGSPCPELATLRDFVRFHASIAKGIIDVHERITAESVNTTLEHFFAGFT